MSTAPKKKNESPDSAPPDDLREEWQEEDREIEGRKPTLEEIEEDPSDL